jgi:hypothetical protein
VQALSRDNSILKRAVAVQNQRRQVAPPSLRLPTRRLQLMPYVLQCSSGAHPSGRGSHAAHSTHYSSPLLLAPLVYCRDAANRRSRSLTLTALARLSRTVSVFCVQEEHAAHAAQMSTLQQTVVEYESRLRTAEMNNYALSMHLRQAASAGGSLGRNPDVC